MRILVAEDDEHLRKSIVAQLKAALYVVDPAPDGSEALHIGKEYPIDLAIVDLGLPGLTGIELIKALRKEGKRFPILILTARDRWQDKVLGLEAGADDYMVKPFQMEEILARVRALLRRSQGWADATMVCGPLELNPGAQTVSVAGSKIDLTAYEYKILEYLMIRAGEVISKSKLSDHVYGDEEDRDSNVIEVLIGRLRKKLDPKGNLNLLETLRGRGYRITSTRK